MVAGSKICLLQQYRKDIYEEQSVSGVSLGSDPLHMLHLTTSGQVKTRHIQVSPNYRGAKNFSFKIAASHSLKFGRDLRQPHVLSYCTKI